MHQYIGATYHLAPVYWCCKHKKNLHNKFGLALGFAVAEFIDPDWGDKVNSGIRLLYWPDRLHGLADRYDNPMLELTLSPQSGIYEFGF